MDYAEYWDCYKKNKSGFMKVKITENQYVYLVQNGHDPEKTKTYSKYYAYTCIKKIKAK